VTSKQLRAREDPEHTRNDRSCEHRHQPYAASSATQIRQGTTAASGAVCVPATCPIERSAPGTHGHSWNMHHGADLRRRWSSGVQSQPSKLVIQNGDQ
jgi:hypothetical protein